MNTQKDSYSTPWSRDYEIYVREHVDPKWADWFNGMTLVYHDTGYTRLIGKVPDQAALHGILNTIRDIGFTLLSVNPIADDTEQEDDEDPPRDFLLSVSSLFDVAFRIRFRRALRADIISIPPPPPPPPPPFFGGGSSSLR